MILTAALRAAGVPAWVLRPVHEPIDGDSLGAADHLIVFSSRRELVRRLREFDVVFSFTASLGFALEGVMFTYPLLRRFGWPPYINVSTGSDIAERARESSMAGALQRFTMRHAFAQSVPPYPEAIRTAARLRLGNTCLLPPVQITHAEHLTARPAAESWRFRRSSEELLFLHASNLDWAVADAGRHRTSTKGNDRFLRAFAAFVTESRAATRVVMLERGPDVAAAHRLVDELGLADHVTWSAGLPRDELFDVIREVDVVVDQFDVGALGMIAWEAFNLGRPVLTYVDPSAERLTYDENSPVLNAHTIDEIVERLRELAIPENLTQRTDDAWRWATTRSMERLVVRYLYFATVASGFAAEEFGWNRPHGHAEARDG